MSRAGKLGDFLGGTLEDVKALLGQAGPTLLSASTFQRAILVAQF
jgi:hypothetical protein